jgi:hypothetical protein
MRTKYLDDEILRLTLLERFKGLDEWRKAMLAELQEIKQASLMLSDSNSRLAELEEENYKLRYCIENDIGECDIENDCC